MKITKLLALILAIVLSLGAMTSCDVVYTFTADKLLTMADEKLMNEPYKMNIQVAFSSDNKELNSVLSMVNDADLEVRMDGENIAVNMDMWTEIMNEEVGISMEYIIIKHMIYATASVEVRGMTQSLKQKAEMTKDELDEFISDNISDGEVTPSNFEKKDLKFSDGKFIITCTDITKETAEDLEKEMMDQLGSISEVTEIEVEDVEVICTMNGLEYEKVKLSCKYLIKIGTEVFATVNYVSEIDYDYGEEYAVKKPDGAQGYLEVDYDDLLSDFS